MAENKSIKEDLNMQIFSNSMFGGSVIDAETTSKLMAVFEIARKSVCKVKPIHNDQGTGSFLEALDCNNKLRFIFMTGNKVLPTNSRNEICQTILEFEGIQQMTGYTWDKHKKHLKFIWTSKLYGATVIEISTELADLFKSYGVLFLKVGKIVPKTKVPILQYINGKFGIMTGEINHINGYEVFYQLANGSERSGSHIFDWNCMALAIHISSQISETEDKPTIWLKAYANSAIIDAYLEEQANDFLLYVE